MLCFAIITGVGVNLRESVLKSKKPGGAYREEGGLEAKNNYNYRTQKPLEQND